jgi:hypothetical protein
MSDDRKREPLGDQDNQADGAETGAGAEATRGMQGKPKGDSQTPRSSYGGDGGEPKEPKDFPQSRR